MLTNLPRTEIKVPNPTYSVIAIGRRTLVYCESFGNEEKRWVFKCNSFVFLNIIFFLVVLLNYFSHNYLAGEDKTISINMKKIENVETYFTVKEKNKDLQFDLSSQIYLNSLFLGNNPVSVFVSDKTYIGEIVSNKNEDNYSFFILKNGYNSENLKNQKNENGENIVALQVDIPEAKEKFINANYRLVVSIAKKYRKET